MSARTDLNALSLDALYDELNRDGLVERLFELARDEDLGAEGADVTTEACAAANTEGAAPIVGRMVGRVVGREACVVAGLRALPALLGAFAPASSAEPATRDGSRVGAGAEIARVTGSLRELMALERTLLNTLSRLSGVATQARAFVDQAAGTGAHVYDTRKTTPGLRALEKYAVRCGGACCHRVGLYDAVLIKDNHLAGVALGDLAGFVERAASAARRGGNVRFVEVEVDSLAQLEAVLRAPAGLVDIALLDNMDEEELAAAVGLRDRVRPSVELEASGGVTLETIGGIARTGVERISAGALTHGARAVDIAMEIV